MATPTLSSNAIRAAILIVSISSGALGGCQAQPQPVHIGEAVEGRLLVEQLCADCHAIDPGAISPNGAAPPLSEVLDRYGATALAEDLDNAVPVSHLRMPTFHLGEGHAADIVAYLKAMKEKADSN